MFPRRILQVLLAGLLACAVLLTSVSRPSPLYADTSTHTTKADFLSGTSDGGVEIPALGELRLVPLGTGTLGSWSAVTSLPSAIFGLRAGHSRGYIFVVGGVTGDSTFQSTTYSTLVGANGTIASWSAATSLPQATYAHAAVAFNGRLYVLGGETCSMCFQSAVYSAPISTDGTIGSWTAIAKLPQALSGLSAVAVNGHLYVTGGWNGNNQSSIYSAPIKGDGTIGNWSALASLPKAVANHSAVAYNGYLFVVAGEQLYGNWQAGVYSAPIDADGTIGNWSTLTSLPQAIGMISSAALNGYLYVTGGYNGNTQATVYAAPINPDGTIGNWASVAGLPQAAFGHSAVGLEGYLYVMGGRRNTSGGWTNSSAVYSSQLNVSSSLVRQGNFWHRFDLGTDKYVQSLSWSGQSNGQTVRVRYRTATSSNPTFGPWSSPYVTSTIPISGTARWVEYWIQMEGDGTNTPVVDSVSLSYYLPLTAGLLINGGSLYVNSTAVALSPSASGGDGGVASMSFSDDGITFSAWEPYTTTRSYNLPAGEGTKTVWAKFMDGAGNVSQPVSAAVTLDSTPPTGSLSIISGGAYANSFTATLTISGTDNLSGVSAMSFSNDGSTWSDWQGYTASKSWPLASGPDGPRTAFARFRDAAQNVSPVYSDTIILDTTAPTGTITINGGASDTNTTAVTLTLSAGDGLSGLGQMSFSNDGQSYTAWEDYATSKSWTVPGGNGLKTVYARFKDGAGNVSSPVTDTIILNTTAPSSAVDPLGLYQNTAAFTVTWSGSASGSGLAAYDVQYRDGPSGQWTDWINNTLSTSAVFTGTEGHTYYFQSRATDLATNVEPYPGGAGDTHTTVDLTPPTGSLSINGGALDTTALTVTLALSASDALSGVSQASYSDDGSSWSGWESYAASRSWTVPTGDGEKPVWARFRDNAGNVSSPVSDTIRLDTTVDPAYGLSVNDGALFTSQVTVTLDLPANPNTAQMMVSNDGGFYGGTWESYAAYRPWAITQYGSYVIARTVYVKFKDVAGNVSGGYQDDIILDLNAPSGTVSIEGSGTVTGTNAVATTAVTLRLSASDDVSGVGGMLVSNSPAFSGASWESLAASKSWNMESGGKVYVAFKDNAGNASPVYAASLSGGKESLPAVVLGSVHPKTGGAVASSETGTTVSFPPGAVAAKAEVTLAPAVESNLQANTGALKSAGKFLTLTAKAGETPVTSVSKPYTITVGYTAADVAGMDESSLGIYWWNGSAWQKEPTSRVDTAARTVSAAIGHLSAFALLGESSTRTVYLPLVIRSYSSGW